jgi:hypothetical protein
MPKEGREEGYAVLKTVRGSIQYDLRGGTIHD